MQAVRRDIDALHTVVTITLEPQDYKPEFEIECKKYKNKVQLKGFRKGMTPIGTIKKMYGRAILSDVINEKLQSSLFDYVEKEELQYIGQPLASTETESIVLDHTQDKDYNFSFELGLSPKVDVKGVSEDDQYDIFDVTITDDLVEKDIENYRRQRGTREDVEDMIQEMDYVTIDAEEVHGSYKTDIKILVNLVHDEAIKNDLLSKKVGDQISFDVTKLEDKDKNYIDKYILKKPEDFEGEITNEFKGSISNVSRIKLAEFNDELFQSFGTDSVTDESSMRDHIKQEIKSYYDQQAQAYMNRDIMDHILDINDIQLPDSFLQRYLVETNDKATPEQVASEYPGFSKNMKWSLVKSSLARKYDIQVEEEDLRHHFSQTVFKFMRNYGMQDYSFMDSTINKLMEDKEQVNKAVEEILADKVFEKISTTIKMNKKPISVDDFAEKVKVLNERLNNL